LISPDRGSKPSWTYHNFRICYPQPPAMDPIQSLPLFMHAMCLRRLFADNQYLNQNIQYNQSLAPSCSSIPKHIAKQHRAI
jgi:hypothetical protein